MSFVDAALSSEEDRLWKKFRDTRDRSIRNDLVERYLPLARQLASTLFAKRPDNDVEFSDYMQYACVGLIEAVDRYDTSKGAMFKTFAGYRIKGAVLNGVGEATEKRTQYSAYKTNRSDRLSSISLFENDSDDSFYEMVEITVGLALGYMLDEIGVETSIITSKGKDPYGGHAYQQTCKRIQQALYVLDERERRIIQYHYYHQMSFESLADLYGLSKGRISQLHKQALCKIRLWLQNNDVVDKIY